MLLRDFRDVIVPTSRVPLEVLLDDDNLLSVVVWVVAAFRFGLRTTSAPWIRYRAHRVLSRLSASPF